MMHSAALRAEIEREGGEIIARIAQREPAKILAFKVGIKPRHSYNLRTERPASQWPTFIMMALQYPELRAAIARWLEFDNKNAPVALEALEQIRRIVETMPDEGDRNED